MAKSDSFKDNMATDMKTKFSSFLSFLYDLFDFTGYPHVEFNEKKVEDYGLDGQDVRMFLFRLCAEKVIIDYDRRFEPLPNEQYNYIYKVIANKRVIKEKLQELGIGLSSENNRGVIFDPQAWSFRYGGSVYKIQKKNKKRFIIARELYSNRREVVGKKELKKGTPLTKGQLAIAMHDEKSAQKLSPADFAEVEAEIKALNREFNSQRHIIPLRIKISGSVLMTESVSR